MAEGGAARTDGSGVDHRKPDALGRKASGGAAVCAAAERAGEMRIAENVSGKLPEKRNRLRDELVESIIMKEHKDKSEL